MTGAINPMYNLKLKDYGKEDYETLRECRKTY